MSWVGWDEGTGAELNLVAEASVVLVGPFCRTMDVLDGMVAEDVVAVESLVKRLLATSGMTIGAPLRTRKQKAAKLLFYIFDPKKGQIY